MNAAGVQSQSEGTIDSRVLFPSLEMSPLFHLRPRPCLLHINIPPNRLRNIFQLVVWAKVLLFILKIYRLLPRGIFFSGNIGGGRKLWYLCQTEEGKLGNPDQVEGRKSWWGGGRREEKHKREKESRRQMGNWTSNYFSSLFYPCVKVVPNGSETWSR